MYQLVMFDLDGTLVDTVESIAEAGNRMLSDCGFDKRKIEEYKYFAGDGVHELVRRALYASGDTEYSLYERAIQSYQQHLERTCTYHVKAYDGIIPMLSNLKEKGIKIAVLTNKPHDRAISVVNEIFGENYFDSILGQKEGMNRKPDPEGAFYLMNELQIKPSDCIYVGDTDVDMITGNKAGMFTVGVLWGFRDREELEKFEPDAIINEPNEILKFIGDCETL